MPIKKRSSKPTAEQAAAPKVSKPLVIVAAPKKPIPKGSTLQAVYGDNVPPARIRRIGHVADTMGETPEEALHLSDKVTAMRTPYDPNNPQEQRYRNRVRNRATAVTAMCITCVGGRKAVTECVDTLCPLWAFRFGSDPFFGKKRK